MYLRTSIWRFWRGERGKEYLSTLSPSLSGPGCSITGLFFSPLSPHPSLPFPPVPLPLSPPHLQSGSWMTTRQSLLEHYSSPTIYILTNVTTNDYRCSYHFPTSPSPRSTTPSMMSKAPEGVRDSPLDYPLKNWGSDCQHIT